ncbi:MAG TPA: methyl-accepting chemotaxis protein [Fibrobacteria bacterium]|nr:methyl-accepting chemotaxis protein [Fibrobacteria bacterium]
MFKNMKLGLRLGIGFGLLVVLMATVGAIALDRIGKINDKVHVVVEDRMPKTKATNEWIDAVNSIARILRNSVIADDPRFIERELERIAGDREKIDKAFKYLEETILSKEGKEFLAAAADLRMPIRDGQNKIMEFAKVNNDTAAANLLFGSYRELQGKYLKALAELNKFQEKLAMEDGEETAAIATATTTLVVLLLVVAAFLALFIAWLVTRSITGPVSRCIDIAEKVAKGETDMVIVVDSTDETGVLMGAMKKMVDTLNELVGQMKHMAIEHDKGDIDVQVDAAKFHGAFQDMGRGVNNMVNGHIAVKKKAMACVGEFGKGNFDAPLEKFPGKKAFINEAVEGMRTNLKAIATQVGDLIEASKAGRLDTRGDARKFQGDWSKLVAGVNEMLDAILLPIQEAAQVLDKVAARDLTARVAGNYQGDHAKIKNALNLAVENLETAMGQVQEATQQVASASGQISSGSQSLAQGANEQASSLEEVSASLEEMSSMTRQNADNALAAKNLAGEADIHAKTGTEAMERMSSAINKIKESSDQTAKIVKTIDEIAMQTNLLALNAAVEAARAGEAGRGFAVVAEEVRNLAQRSAQAAKNTADMIGESVKNAGDGVKISEEVSVSFDKIATSSKKVNDLIAEIAAASKEQAQGIKEVNDAISQMDKVTQQNAANAEESASASEELSSQAQELQAMVGQFRIAGGASVMVGKPKSVLHHQKRPALAAPASPTKSVGKSRVSADDQIPMDEDTLREF